MTVLVIGTWVVKPEKQQEHKRLWQRFLEYMKKNPKLFKEMKSMKYFTQTFGGISGAYVELDEYESLADYETCEARISKDEGCMKIVQEWMLLIDPATYTTNVCTAIM